jgi:hypothetical protein
MTAEAHPRQFMSEDRAPFIVVDNTARSPTARPAEHPNGNHSTGAGLLDHAGGYGVAHRPRAAVKGSDPVTSLARHGLIRCGDLRGDLLGARDRRGSVDVTGENRMDTKPKPPPPRPPRPPAPPP